MATWQEERHEWQEAMVTAAKNNDFGELVRLMSANPGDAGDVLSMIDNFCANCDPSPDWRKAF